MLLLYLNFVFVVMIVIGLVFKNAAHTAMIFLLFLVLVGFIYLC